MCGIVGYVGGKNVLPILIEGLRRVEYRGYDSAGIAAHDPVSAGLTVVRAEGSVIRLEKKLAAASGDYRCGIGHTRWATHGPPTERNAHPHLSADGRIAVVHNGTIENHSQLRALLVKEGVVFASDTDTEVIAQLIAKFYTDGDLLAAVSSALKSLTGTYGLAILAVDQPGVIIGARNGSPLVVGIGDGEMLLASDYSPLLSHTRDVIYLGDRELVELRADSWHIYNLDSVEISKDVERLQIEVSEIDKAGYDHYMLKEIYEQPETVTNCCRGRLLADTGMVKLGGLAPIEDRLTGFKRIVIAACGTSWHAALIGEYLIEELAGIPVEVEYASEFRYRNPLVNAETLVIVVSQSGETADTLAALYEARLRGATVIGVCNGIGSSIARETVCGIYLHAGIEVGVASTKAFTSQVTALLLLAIRLGRSGKLSGSAGIELVRALGELPGQLREVLAVDKTVREIAARFSSSRNFLYLGRGIQFPVALEGALKLKEISYIHAEGYPAAEMKHGPIALIDADMPVVVIALRYGVYEKILNNIEEVGARHGKVIVIASEGDEEIRRKAEYVIHVPRVPEALSPILSVVPLQLLAYHIAVARGCDVDKPRNLAKSVTVE